MPVVDLDTLNCVYFSLFFIGLGYAIFVVITGGLSDVDMPDVDIDIGQIDLPGDVDFPGADIQIGADAPAGIDAPDVSVSPLSPITIATFITTFGGIGVIATQFLAIDPRWSLLWATGGALLLSGIMFAFYSQVLIGSQGSSEIRASDLIGLTGEVIVPVGESSPGQVTYVTKSGRMNSMARSVDGRPIPRGTFVTIVRLIGQLALVRPLAPEEEKEEKEQKR